MFDYVIVHGSYGSPFENWFPWLYSELTARGKNVLLPQFPCGEGIQNYENWKKVLDSYRSLIDERTTFVGHSLAPAFIVDYKKKKKMSVNNLILVVPFYGEINIPDFDAVNKPFFFLKNLEKVTDYCKKRICYISNTDPYVPNTLSNEFAKIIDAQVKTFNDAGHFNASAGFTEFSAILEDLL